MLLNNNNPSNNVLEFEENMVDIYVYNNIIGSVINY